MIWVDWVIQTSLAVFPAVHCYTTNGGWRLIGCSIEILFLLLWTQSQNLLMGRLSRLELLLVWCVKEISAWKHELLQGVLFSQTLDWRGLRLLTASLFTFLYCNCIFFPKSERRGGLYRRSFDVTLFYLLLLFMHWFRELCGGLTLSARRVETIIFSPRMFY